MSDPIVHSSSEASRPLARYQWCVPYVLFSVLWIDLIRQLSHTWETREQYSYGWFVPGFALYLFWRRWTDRPAATNDLPTAWWTTGAITLSVLLLPLRVVFEINVDWPLIIWIYTGMVVVLTLYALQLAGGWSWVRHFAFPVAFILVAVAWPHRIEKTLTQNLMQVVANLTVEVLGLAGVPALQQGNLIEVSTGVVGVDEACSGIRSFQSALMGALFMGELYRLRLLPRATLLGCGLALAFLFNTIRTFLLSWKASKDGVAIVDKWHDSAGLTITVACFLGLWLVAGWIHSRSPRVPESRSSHTGPLPSRRLRRYLAWIGCWTIVALLGTEGWYRYHDARSQGGFQWSFASPTNNSSLKEIELTPKVSGKIGHDEGGAFTWREGAGVEWAAYFFRWNPRTVQAVMMSRAHRPEVCLPATGYRQVGESTMVLFDAGALKLPFRKYIYEASGQTMFVFFCQWEDGEEEQQGMRASKQGDRLQSVLSGRRKVGQQTLELILTGYGNADEAELAVRRKLPELVRAQRTGATAIGPVGSQARPPA